METNVAGMARTFIYLAIGNFLVLIATGATGLLHEVVGTQRHVVLAVFTLLVSCLVQVLVMTYFSVTGRVVSQAIHLANLDPAPLKTIARCKRTVTHRIFLLLGAVVFVTAAGAARWRSGAPSQLHLLSAGAVLLVHWIVLSRQYRAIVTTQGVSEIVLSAYGAWRSRVPFKGKAEPGQSISAEPRVV